MRPPIPADESSRLAVIARHGLAEPGREYVFDRIADLMANLFEVPIALVTILGSEFQCFRGARGIDAPGGPRDMAFCAFTILSDQPMIVPDAQTDPRFHDHPLVLDEPHIRFYAGVPLMLDGQAVGTLCITDRTVRDFSEGDAQRLATLADIVVEMLRMRLDRLSAEGADRRLRYIIDAMPTGLLVYGADNRLVSFNKTFREMMFGEREEGPEPGLTRQELLDRFEKTGRTIDLATGTKSFREHLGESERAEPWELRTSDGQWLSVREVRAPDGHLISVSTDITELKRREQELDVQSRLLRATLDSVDQGIALFDADRRQVVGNERLPALLHLPQGLCGTGAELGALLRAIARQGKGVGGDVDFFSSDDPDIRALGESREATFEMPGGRFLRLKVAVRAGGTVILTCADITEEMQAERLKAELVSTVSHELRTPLTSISGALQILGSGLVGEMAGKARDFVELARKNCDRLSQMVNDLLEVDRIESGQIQLDRKRVELRALLQRAIEHNSGYAAQFGVRVELQEDGGDGGIAVLADEARLLQVADNLLSNAIKYSPPGEAVTVALSAADGEAHVTVRDLGPGIPEEFRPKVFHRFARADSSDRRATQGSGLGLSIARGIVEQHGGRISFETETGRGTSFRVDLPLHAPLRKVRAAPERPTVLMCLKAADTARSLTATLERAGVAVEPASTLTRERVCESGDYAGVLLELPGEGDPLAVVHSLRCREDVRRPPTVLLAPGLGDAEGKTRAIRQAVLSRAAGSGSTGQSDGAVPRPRILHVEDDVDLLYLIAESFSGTATVDGAPDLATARQLLETGEYDLVILDLILPDGDGSELLPAILSQAEGSTPVVVFSALEPDKGLAARVDVTLTKSQDSIDDLLRVSRDLAGLGADEEVGGAA